MTEPLPKWVKIAYAKLWVKFQNRDFFHDEAFETLSKTKTISIILSKLKKFGWLETRLHPDDSRRRVYKLRSPQEATKEIALGK